MFQRLAQPRGQILVVNDAGQFGEEAEIHPQHLRLHRSSFHRGPRNHHRQLQQQALQHVAPFFPRTVNMDKT